MVPHEKIFVDRPSDHYVRGKREYGNEPKYGV